MTNKRLNELLDTNSELLPGHLLISVGSWNAYNERSEHSTGTPFLDFMRINGAEELEEVLKALGWSDEERQELFIQDYISDIFKTKNADFENPGELADFVKEKLGQFTKYDYSKLLAIEEATTSDFYEAVDCLPNYDLIEGTAADYAEEIAEQTYKLDDYIKYYIDFEKMGQDMLDEGGIYETSSGVLIEN